MSAREPIEDGILTRPDVEMLFPSPTNPRKSFDPVALQELADSIKQFDVMQPILVRPIPAAMKEAHATHAELEIVAGERRWRASQLAGLASVPVIIRHLDDSTVIRLQIIENLQRQDLSAIEEAEGYGVLQQQGLTAQQIAQEVGKSKAYIYAKLKLLALCEAGREKVRQGQLSESVALLIARIPVEALQLKAIEDVLEPQWNGDPMSYREAAREIQNAYTVRLKGCPFDLEDAVLVLAAGSCQACPKRLGNDPDADPAHADICIDPDCFAAKKAAARELAIEQAQTKGQAVISGDEAKKIKRYPSAPCEAGYVGLDDKCYELDGYPTYGSLLAKANVVVDVVLIDSPVCDAPITAIKKDALSEALKKSGIELIAAKNTASEERAKEEEALQAENRYRQRLFSEVRKQPMLMLTTPDLAMLATFALHRLYEEYRFMVGQLWFPGSKRKESVERLLELIPTLGDQDLNRLLRDILLAPETKACPWRKDEPTQLLEAATRIGIDPERVRRDQVRADAGKTVVYRHPDDPETYWDGQGVKPLWLITLEGMGTTLEELADEVETPAKAKRKSPKKG